MSKIKKTKTIEEDLTSNLKHRKNSIGGAVTFIPVAGGTDALSGIVSYHAISGPIISCPPDAPNESCTRNPPGSCNAYVPRPENVGKFVAQIYAPFNKDLGLRLIQMNKEKIEKLREEDGIRNKKYADRQRR